MPKGENDNFNDEITIILNQINGINISDFKLLKDFYNLNKKIKIKIIFKKENQEKYL